MDRTAHSILRFVSSPVSIILANSRIIINVMLWILCRAYLFISAFETVVGCRIQNSKHQKSLIILKRIPKIRKYSLFTVHRWNVIAWWAKWSNLFIFCFLRHNMHASECIQVGSVSSWTEWLLSANVIYLRFCASHIF